MFIVLWILVLCQVTRHESGNRKHQRRPVRIRVRARRLALRALALAFRCIGLIR
jgi:hypothetical protein